MATRTDYGSLELNEYESALYKKFQRLVAEGAPPFRAASSVMEEFPAIVRLLDDPVSFERDILLNLDEVAIVATERDAGVNLKLDPHLPPMISFPGPRKPESLNFDSKSKKKK